MSIEIDARAKDVCDFLDQRLSMGFELTALRKKNNIDFWAANYALGNYGAWRFVSDPPYQHPVMLLEKVRKFYRDHPVKTLTYSFADEAEELMVTLDQQAGTPLFGLFESSWNLPSSLDHDDVTSAYCVADIAWSLLFFPHGIAYVPGHGSQEISEYGQTLFRIDEELRRNANLCDVFKAVTAEESIKYLLGEKVGQLNEIVGFTPLDPLELVAKDGVSDQQVQGAVLKIRKDCGKIRDIFEKVHLNCLSLDIDAAVEAKRDLAELDANRSINYPILEHMGEFIGKPFEDAVHTFIDKMLESETSSRLVELTKYLKEYRQNRLVGLLSEARFLTFAAMVILAFSKLTFPGVVSDILGKVGLVTGGVGVTSKLLEKGIKLHPGFNLYASFIDWPR